MGTFLENTGYKFYTIEISFGQHEKDLGDLVNKNLSSRE